MPHVALQGYGRSDRRARRSTVHGPPLSMSLCAGLPEPGPAS